MHASVCEPYRFYSRPKLPLCHPYAYAPTPFAPREDVTWWAEAACPGNQIRFAESDDRAIQYIRRFLALEPTGVTWYHVIVRARVLDAFFLAFEAYHHPKKPRAFLLEYSCWCDGGADSLDPLDRHHRHMIVVARHGNHFLQRCWRTLPESALPPTKLYRKMESWQHLQNTLFYVSSRKATCSLTYPSPEATPELYHYYLFKPVTAHFKLCVALTIHGGIDDFITTHKRHGPVRSLAPYCVRQTASEYAVPIRHVMAPEWAEKVVPVRKDFVPTGVVNRLPSAAFLILPDGQYMHFEHRKACADLEDSAWLQLQKERGNLLLKVMQDAWWTPPEPQQRVLEELVPQWQAGEAALRRQKEIYSTLLATQQAFFLKLFSQAKTNHREHIQHQKTFYQLRYELKKTYLEKMIDWCGEREEEMETRADYYKQQWDAVKVTLLNPTTSTDTKLQHVMDTVCEAEAKEEAERERREKVAASGFEQCAKWAAYKNQWEAGLECLQSLLQQFDTQPKPPSV